MLKRNLVNSLAVTAFVVASFFGAGPSVSAEGGNSNAHNRITICHATGSESNPYVTITVNANGAVSGHAGHQGGRDIIPPFTYNDHGSIKQFPGLNWNANGQSIFNNDCKPVHHHTPDHHHPGDGHPHHPGDEHPHHQGDGHPHHPGDGHPQHPPVNGGQGGGDTVTGPSTTTGGSGAGVVAGAQVVAPVGAVNAGSGTSQTGVSLAPLLGTISSLAIAGFGLRRLSKFEG